MSQGELEKEVLAEYRKLIKEHKSPKEESIASIQSRIIKSKKKNDLGDEERQRIIEIMAKPIKKEATELHYLAQDRQRVRQILNGGILL